VVSSVPFDKVSMHIVLSACLPTRSSLDSRALAHKAPCSVLFHPRHSSFLRSPSCFPAANASSPPPSPLTRSVSSVLLDSSPLAVEGVVGRTLKALRADARRPAAGSGVAESGQRKRGARGGAEAEHYVVCIACGGVSGEVVRGSAGSSL
jgi:hypothetical protein